SYYLHWNTAEKNRRLVRIISNSLTPGGKLVLIEFLSGKEQHYTNSSLCVDKMSEVGEKLPHSSHSCKEEASVAAYNTGNLLLNNFDGHAPSLEELLFLSKEAGFKDSE